MANPAEDRLFNLAREALVADPGKALGCARDALTVFQRLSKQGTALSCSTYVSLLIVLERAGAWNSVICIYASLPFQVETALQAMHILYTIPLLSQVLLPNWSSQQLGQILTQ